jgi:hypothetical protein
MAALNLSHHAVFAESLEQVVETGVGGFADYSQPVGFVRNCAAISFPKAVGTGRERSSMIMRCHLASPFNSGSMDGEAHRIRLSSKSVYPQCWQYAGWSNAGLTRPNLPRLDLVRFRLNRAAPMPRHDGECRKLHRSTFGCGMAETVLDPFDFSRFSP